MGAMQQALLMSKSIASAPDPIMPYFVDDGTVGTSQAAINAAYPLTRAVGDVLILLVESANQTIATPSGWTQVANSPQSTGTAAAAGGVRLAVFYHVLSGTVATTFVTVADSGDHTVAKIFGFRAADITAPIDVTAGSVKSSAIGTTFTLPSVTTSSDKALVLLCVGQDRDLNSTTNLSAWTNANLTDITELADQTSGLGVGGGIGLAVGGKATAGSTGTTTVTSAVATTATFITVALKCNTGYFTQTRVTGAYGSATDDAYNSSQASASITIGADGSITTTGSTKSDNGSWVNLPASGVGSGYWVKADGTANGTGSNSGTTGSWLALTQDQTWSVTATGGTQSENWNLTLQFATDSAGTNVVATGRFSLSAVSNTGPIP